MDNKKRPRPLIDDTYNLRPLGEDEEDTRLDPGTDVIEPAFDAREQALNEQQALTTDLSEQDLQTQQARDSQDLAMGITQGVRNIGQNALAPARGAVRSAFAQTDDMLGKSLDAQKQNRLDIRGMVADARRREDASQQNQANLRAQGIDLRQRLGMEPLAELQERIGLSKQLAEPEDMARPGRQVAMRTESVILDDGQRVLTTFNPNTGQFIDPKTGEDISSRVARRAYSESVRVDPVTGDLITIQPGAGAVTPTVPRDSGLTPRELNERERQRQAFLQDDLARDRARLQQELGLQSYDKKTDIQRAAGQQKEQQKVERAIKSFDAFAKDYTDSLDKASPFLRGPVTGRAASAFSNLTGFTLDPNLSEAENRANAFVTQYLYDTAGKQVNKTELEKIVNQLPKPGDSADLVASKLAAFRRALEVQANILRNERGEEPLPQSQIPTPSPGVIDRRVSGAIQQGRDSAIQQAGEALGESTPQQSTPTNPRDLPVGARIRKNGIEYEKTEKGWRPVQ